MTAPVQGRSTLPPCVLIGDIVGSRSTTDRQALHDAVEAALAAVDDVVPSVNGLRVTAGDEFQGTYATLGAAVEAALRVRLALLPQVDTRFGLGRGDVAILDPVRGIEDGPGWWAARAAIEEVEESAGRAPTRLARTAYRAADDRPSVEPDVAEPAVNAALLCRDHLVGSLSDRSLRLLRGLMDPHTTQGELAAREGISASAVSQRVRTDGIGAVLAAHELLRGMP
ncbi:MAG TPA: SatD family protein [Ornithinibacter sp.]|nr:SatD family protein [Ornithinibacter sp.]